MADVVSILIILALFAVGALMIRGLDHFQKGAAVTPATSELSDRIKRGAA